LLIILIGNNMNDFERGKRDGMRETLNEELKNSAMRIAVLEEELHKEREKKWNVVHKLNLVDMDGYAVDMILDQNEPLTLHDKIERIKEGFTL
tara:strand:+ start:908 stop:1186 length:279 start_codon:yes stop_codon:yes gene_type:complete